LDNRSIFVIGAWPDTKEKEKVLLNKIRFLREKQYPICLVTHYPVDIKFKNYVIIISMKRECFKC